MAHQTSTTGHKFLGTVILFSVTVMILTWMLVQQTFERKLAEKSLGQALEALEDQDRALAACRRSQGKSEPAFFPIGPIPHVSMRSAEYTDHEPLSWLEVFRSSWLR